MEEFTNFLNERFGLDDLVDIGIQFSIEDDKIYLNYNDYKVPLSVSEEDEEFLFVDKELKVDGSAEYNNYYFSSEKNKLMEFKILKLESETLENTDPVFESSDYLSLFGFMKYDSFDKKYFSRNDFIL